MDRDGYNGMWFGYIRHCRAVRLRYFGGFLLLPGAGILVLGGLSVIQRGRSSSCRNASGDGW